MNTVLRYHSEYVSLVKLRMCDFTTSLRIWHNLPLRHLRPTIQPSQSATLSLFTYFATFGGSRQARGSTPGSTAPGRVSSRSAGWPKCASSICALWLVRKFDDILGVPTLRYLQLPDRSDRASALRVFPTTSCAGAGASCSKGRSCWLWSCDCTRKHGRPFGDFSLSREKWGLSAVCASFHVWLSLALSTASFGNLARNPLLCLSNRNFRAWVGSLCTSVFCSSRVTGSICRSYLWSQSPRLGSDQRMRPLSRRRPSRSQRHATSTSWTSSWSISSFSQAWLSDDARLPM